LTADNQNFIWIDDDEYKAQKKALFEGCRLIQADLDLLDVLLCDGAIASAVCYSDLKERSEAKLRGLTFLKATIR